MTTTLLQPTWRRLALGLLASATLLLGGCAALRAQNPDSALAPVRASAVGGDSHVMLDGHDVVSYFTDNRHAMGQPQFKSQYQGVSFHFASAAHKALFDAAPQRYLPQYGGFCANGIAYAIPWGGDADTWRIIDGKLYIFGGAGSRDAFLLDLPGNRRTGRQVLGRRSGRQQQLLAAQQAPGAACAALRQRRRTGPARGRSARQQALIGSARRRWLGTAAALGAGSLLLPACTLQAQRDHTGANAPAAVPLDRPPRVAWVFGSGGPRGHVHVGVLKAPG